MKTIPSTLLFISLFLLQASGLIAQELNPIITAFPSLRIPASSRGMAMGDCGIASATENQQLWYNAAKSAFTQNFHQASVTYSPYLAGISNDIKFLNANYLANVSNTSAFGISLSYLSLGNMATKDDNGAMIAFYKSSEFNLGASYALQVGAKASLGMALRFLGSQPAQFQEPNGYGAIPRHLYSASADISYYQYYDLDGNGRKLEWGTVISNIGPKVSLQGNDQKTFLPTNLGIGISYTTGDQSTGDRFTVALDINKLLVPTPPVYDATGTITAGKDPDRSILNALLSSFSDAPGGMAEELREIRVSAGLEYSFADQFFMRAGLSLENRLKGNKKFTALGVGYKGAIKDQAWGLNFHYLIPFGMITGVSPFQNSWGFTLKLNVGNFQ
ncbi:MAG: type IX secretion system outer membrane channel protein PorV [Chitinophagaceae bacterium]|nr:type IX secretion system outer membrane channel protein PorV [Chitinophagaceae bacterium]